MVTLNAVLQTPLFYGAYVAVWAGNLAVIGTFHGWLASDVAATRKLAAINAARSFVVLVPAMLVAGETTMWVVLATLFSVPAALALIAPSRKMLVAEPTRAGAWIQVTLSVSLGTLLSFTLFGVLQGRVA